MSAGGWTRRTSVSSNFVRAVDSPSAIERYWSNAGCPTIDDEVSRCWWVIHSLQETATSQRASEREELAGRDRGRGGQRTTLSRRRGPCL